MSHNEYISLRKKFIEAFLDVSENELHKGYYESRILKTVDGLLHTGYFWDLLSEAKIVEESYVIESMREKSQKLYILWDNNIYNAKMSTQELFSALEVDSQDFARLLPDLPEDIYIFDKTFTWVFALTHEEVDGVRYCLFAQR